MAEHLTVDQGVVGSTPISHPKRSDIYHQPDPMQKSPLDRGSFV